MNVTQQDPIPQRIRLGFCHHLLNSRPMNINLYFDYEKELVYRENMETDKFYKALYTGWKNPVFKEAYYHFGGELELASVLNLKYGYTYYGDKSNNKYYNSSTFGISVNLKYVTIHYSEFLTDYSNSILRHDSKIFGITLNNLDFLNRGI